MTKEVEDGRPSYNVAGKTFCFHRSPRPDALDPDTGERLDDVLVFWVEDLEIKDILVESGSVYFTTPHWNGYSAVLVRIPDLKKLRNAELRDRVETGWSSLKTRAMSTFEKLTHEDLDSIKGRVDHFVRRIADRYGYDDVKAREEISRFVAEGGSTGTTAESAAGDDRLDPSGPGDPLNPTHQSATPGGRVAPLTDA